MSHHVFTRHMSIAANAAKLTVNVSILTATGEIIPVEVGVSSPVQAQHFSQYVHRTCNLLRSHMEKEQPHHVDLLAEKVEEQGKEQQLG